ncbi:hypothetical protein JCM19237_4438 [Photobacterium aphoticum]|uniref:Uncharacterized protein n=1 Tax=Photobacterium aphoticum TaxID=754436 RepID=A0A090QYD2_9GAMM|nr:hypothetical protein JCM19237_4438 [Photobacterium aphoticum]
MACADGMPVMGDCDKACDNAARANRQTFTTNIRVDEAYR